MINTDESKMALFDLKQKFLRQIPHPRLIQSAMKKAARFDDQKYEEQTLSAVKLTKNQKDAYLTDFLEQAILRELHLKHQISLANSFSKLIAALQDLYEHQVQLCWKLNGYMTVDFESTHLDAIKMSDPFDLYEILKAVDKGMSKEMIQEEIKNELSQKTFEPGVLATACLRAYKIIIHE